MADEPGLDLSGPFDRDDGLVMGDGADAAALLERLKEHEKWEQAEIQKQMKKRGFNKQEIQREQESYLRHRAWKESYYANCPC